MRHESVVIAADQDCSLHQSVVVKILLTMFVRVCLSKVMMFLKSDDEIISGLVFDPIKNENFYAEKNNGAFFNNHRIRVSKKSQIDDCLFVTGGKVKKKLNFQ